MYQIEFYQHSDEESPIVRFFDSLDDKMAAKLIGLMEILEEKGPDLRMPYSRHLADGIFELRCQQGNNITRVLYFFYYGKRIIITNGFMKKTQKTPPQELKLAQERRKNWIRRNTETSSERKQ